MRHSLSRKEIIENLQVLSDRLRVRHPRKKYNLLLVGRAALSLMGEKGQTKDIDLLKPHPLPEPLRQGIRAVARARRLAADWHNDGAARIFGASRHPRIKRLPNYFNKVSETFSVGENLTIGIVGRQALISLKLFAANPSVSKHVDDLKRIRPTKEELRIAVKFCLRYDPHCTSRDDLLKVLLKLEQDPDEILGFVD